MFIYLVSCVGYYVHIFKMFFPCILHCCCCLQLFFSYIVPFFSYLLQCLSIDEVATKKCCNEDSSGNVLEILNKAWLAIAFLPNELFDLHPFILCPTTTFIVPSLTTNVYELLWSWMEMKFMRNALKSHQYVVKFFY
jgi:hypothetical protein